MDLVDFRYVPTLEMAQDIASQLDEHGIPADIRPNKDLGEWLAGGNAQIMGNFVVRVDADDFTRASHIVDGANMVEDLDRESDYYLYSFNKDELLDVVMNYDEWSTYDVELAKKLLRDLGMDLSDEKLQELKDERYKEISKPKKADPWHIISGYLAALLVPVMGLVIGIDLWLTYRTMPDGKRAYKYEDTDRRKGILMAAVGIVLSCALVFTYVLTNR